MKPLAAGELNRLVTFLVPAGRTIAIDMTAGSLEIDGYVFQETDAGLPLSVPGAGAVPGAPAAALATYVLAVDSCGRGIAAAAALTAVTGALAYLGRPSVDATGGPLPLVDGPSTRAAIISVSEKEQYGGQAFVGDTTWLIKMRYRPGVQPQWQVRCEGVVYRIQEIVNPGQRNFQLWLYCVVLDGAS